VPPGPDRVVDHAIGLAHLLFFLLYAAALVGPQVTVSVTLAACVRGALFPAREQGKAAVRRDNNQHKRTKNIYKIFGPTDLITHMASTTEAANRKCVVV
jgi:hypothetical protein